MKYEKSITERMAEFSNERTLHTYPEEDSYLGSLLEEREKYIDGLRYIESELWDEYGLVLD